jgi:hypothetical protein
MKIAVVHRPEGLARSPKKYGGLWHRIYERRVSGHVPSERRDPTGEVDVQECKVVVDIAVPIADVRM